MAERSETFLSQHMIAYINVDISVTSGGLLDISGTVSLSNVTRAVLLTVPAPDDPATPGGAITLYDCWMAESGGASILDASDMGTGSDYGAVLQHLGIASMDLRFYGNSTVDGYEGVYHTLYDTYHYMSAIADPNNFIWMRTMSAGWGSILLRLAESQLLPLSYVEYSNYLNQSMTTLSQIDKTDRFIPAFNSIFSSLSTLITTATEFDSLLTTPSIVSFLTNNTTPQSILQLRQINDQLYLAERCLLYYQGIEGREVRKKGKRKRKKRENKLKKILMYYSIFILTFYVLLHFFHFFFFLFLVVSSCSMG
jgi:hypothetical protein